MALGGVSINVSQRGYFFSEEPRPAVSPATSQTSSNDGDYSFALPGESVVVKNPYPVDGADFTSLWNEPTFAESSTLEAQGCDAENGSAVECYDQIADTDRTVVVGSVGVAAGLATALIASLATKGAVYRAPYLLAAGATAVSAGVAWLANKFLPS